MSDVPVSSSAHARKVQILVWSGTASITAVVPKVARSRGRRYDRDTYPTNACG